MRFEDTSSFSRSDKDRTPKEFTARADWLRITVHRHIHYPSDVWLVSWSGLGAGMRELKSKSAAGAIREAVAITRSLLRSALDAMGKETT